MPLTLSDISNKSARVTIQYEGESFWVDYYPNKVTIKSVSEIEAGGNEAAVKVFSSLIKAWDVYDDQEHTIMTPITPERLSDFPIDLLTHIIEAVVKEIRPEAVAPHLNGRS